MNNYDSTNKPNNRNIDWQEVENKVSIICRKFNNIDARFKDDLAQELRIHAYYVSDDYYDLQRKAIDFWRSLTRRVYPEVPFIDLELMAGTNKSYNNKLYCESTVHAIKRELNRKDFMTASEIKTNELALRILDIIVEDIDEVSIIANKIDKTIESNMHKYRNGKINLSYLDLMLPDVHYKSISKAFNHLREVVKGLMEMGII